MSCILKSEVLNVLNTLKMTDPDSISNIDKVMNVINNIPCEDVEPVIHCCECKHFIHQDKFIIINNRLMKAGCCQLENYFYNTYDDIDRCVLHIETDFCNNGECEEK